MPFVGHLIVPLSAAGSTRAVFNLILTYRRREPCNCLVPFCNEALGPGMFENQAIPDRNGIVTLRHMQL